MPHYKCRGLCLLAILLVMWREFDVMAAEITRKGGEIAIVGEIGPGDDQRFAKLLGGEKVERVIVNSRGGRIDSAMSIAEKIHQLDVSLTVNEICASACAILFLPAARSVYVEDGAIIVFHAGDPGMHREAVRRGLLDPVELREFRLAANDLMDRLVALERALGKPELFKKVDDVTGYEDFDIQFSKDIDGGWTWSLSNVKYKQAENWIPGANALRAVGIKVNQWRLPSRLIIAFKLWRWPWRINIED